MSILIKALKQAEREHMARATAAAPAFASTAVLEPEAAPVAPAAPPQSARGGEALSLAPVELQEPAAPAGDAQAHAPSRYERRSDPQASTATVDPAPADPTLEEPYDIAPPAPMPPPAAPGASRTLADVLQTTDQGLAPARTPAAAAPASTAPLAAPRAPAEARTSNASAPQPAAQPAPPAAASADDAQAEQRKAARQLMAPAPARNHLRRIGLVLGVSVLLAGALAGAYWQGLFIGLDSLWQPAPPPAPARSLADRMQSLPAAAEKSAKPHARPNVPAAPGGGGVASVAPRHGGATGLASLAGGGNSAAQFKAGAAMAAESARASDAIHLRPPEATPERIRALLQDAYTAAGRGESAVAGRIYQQVIDLDHNNGDAWIGLAALASNSGDSAAANRDYRRALEIDPGDSVALGGLLGMQSGVDPQEAESRLRLLIVHDGAQPALQAALGKMLARQGRWLEAQETFYQAWIADPSQPDVAFNLAVTLERIRQPQPALSFYRRALELAQNHVARFNPAVAQERVAALTPKQP